MDEKTAFDIGKDFVRLLRKKNYQVSRAILYGSFARGNYHENSDIDIAIVLQHLNDPFRAQVEMLKLTWNFNTRIEPHPFAEQDFNSENPVAREIMRTGIEIEV